MSRHPRGSPLRARSAGRLLGDLAARNARRARRHGRLRLAAGGARMHGRARARRRACRGAEPRRRDALRSRGGASEPDVIRRRCTDRAARAAQPLGGLPRLDRAGRLRHGPRAHGRLGGRRLARRAARLRRGSDRGLRRLIHAPAQRITRAAQRHRGLHDRRGDGRLRHRELDRRRGRDRDLARRPLRLRRGARPTTRSSSSPATPRPAACSRFPAPPGACARASGAARPSSASRRRRRSLSRPTARPSTPPRREAR